MPGRRRAFEGIENAEEPVGFLGKRARPKRDREWDAANPSFRVRPEDGKRLTELAEALHVSRDALARALLEAALGAVDGGFLSLEIENEMTESRDRLGRYRVYGRRVVRFQWGQKVQKQNAQRPDQR